MTPQEFIDMLVPYAIDNYKRYGVLPSLTVAQAAHESGFGSSTLSQNANNLFGVKGTGTAGSVTMPTNEEINGKNVKVLADFRQYNNKAESVNDYGKLLSGDRYKSVIAAPNYKAAAFAVYGAGYATDSSYPSKIINLIDQYKLGALDEQVKKAGYVPTYKAPATTTASDTATDSKPITTETSGSHVGGSLNPANWFEYITATLTDVENSLANLLANAAFLIPGILILLIGIYFLFSEPINKAAKTGAKIAAL